MTNGNSSIVGISFDTNREEWKEYIQKNQIKWAQLIDQKGWESTAILTYAIQGILNLILLGPDGKIKPIILRKNN